MYVKRNIRRQTINSNGAMGSTEFKEFPHKPLSRFCSSNEFKSFKRSFDQIYCICRTMEFITINERNHISLYGIHIITNTFNSFNIIL